MLAPFFSIITPLHNKGVYIAQTIQSILEQVIHDWQLIVVENNSCDNGPSVAQRFATENQRIFFFDASSGVSGPGAARNFGLNHASGEWVLFLDADDQIEKGHLESLLALANRNPTANIIAGKWKEYREDNPSKLTLQHPACCDKGRNDLLGYSIAFAPWAVHSAIVRRSAIRDDLRWPEELDQVLGEDIHFWFRLLHQNEVAFCESAGALYRTHTPNRRNQLQEITKWHRGIDAAVTANLNYLKNRSEKPTALQARSLCRLYSELYSQAKKQKAKDIGDDCIAKAQKWHQLAHQQTSRPAMKERIENLLGLKTSIVLRSIFHKITRPV